MNDVPVWAWVLTALGAVAGLANGGVIDAVIGGAVWFAIAMVIAFVIERRRPQRDE